MGDQDAVKRVGVVAWELGGGFEQLRGDVEHAKFACEDERQMARGSQAAGLALDRGLPDRHRAQAAIDGRVEEDAALGLRQLSGVTQRPQGDVGVDENAAQALYGSNSGNGSSKSGPISI